MPSIFIITESTYVLPKVTNYKSLKLYFLIISFLKFKKNKSLLLILGFASPINVLGRAMLDTFKLPIVPLPPVYLCLAIFSFTVFSLPWSNPSNIYTRQLTPSSPHSAIHKK